MAQHKNVYKLFAARTLRLDGQNGCANKEVPFSLFARIFARICRSS